MKLLIIILSALTLTACDKGSIFNGEKRQTEAGWRLESAGHDMRIYEFRPMTAPQVTCVVVAGSQKGGIQCFDNPVEK